MDAAMQANLAALKAQPKFVDEPGTIYNGMRPEEMRQLTQARLNDLIERLMYGPGDLPAKRFALSQFAKSPTQFPGYDTEDRERMCRHLERIMEIVGIEHSGGLLARWLYGPILGTFVWLRYRTN